MLTDLKVSEIINVMNILLERLLIDSYASECEEYQRADSGAEYGISLEDWENENPEEVKEFLNRTWENANKDQRTAWIYQAISNSINQVTRTNEAIDKLVQELLAKGT